MSLWVTRTARTATQRHIYSQTHVLSLVCACLCELCLTPLTENFIITIWQMVKIRFPGVVIYVWLCGFCFCVLFVEGYHGQRPCSQLLRLVQAYMCASRLLKALDPDIFDCLACWLASSFLSHSVALSILVAHLLGSHRPPPHTQTWTHSNGTALDMLTRGKELAQILKCLIVICFNIFRSSIKKRYQYSWLDWPVMSKQICNRVCMCVYIYDKISVIIN